MKETRILMDMPITVEVVDASGKQKDVDDIFRYFQEVDDRFSVFKKTSEISKINAGTVAKSRYSAEMIEILALADRTKTETNGFFDVLRDGKIDPSGIVKGWAIEHAAEILRKKGFKNFCVDAGGDIALSGLNNLGKLWAVGIRNPFLRSENVQVLYCTDCGVATSGSAIRGDHIYNPHAPKTPIRDIVSVTVVGPTILDADRYATAAFAMGKEGIAFIESRKNFEGYMIDRDGIATYTSGWKALTQRNV
ncbi:FAD:protein FMN transferase [Candidatus Gottesmanbacteria bacterium]|nr:FAD:protein FMN transferase [Candidatus Gottesmanbacteria bacterium]